MTGRLRNMTSVYLTDETGILLLYRIGSRVANNKYIGSAGGHFEPNELNDAKACALRELYEELGLTENDLAGFSMRYITLRIKDGEIRQNYYFFARLKEARELSSSEGRLEHIKYEDIPALDMPCSAKHMILHYLAVGRFDDKLYAGITEEEHTRFTEMKEF